MIDHQAIYNTHPTVVAIDDTAGAFDANGKQVVVDFALVDVEAARLKAFSLVMAEISRLEGEITQRRIREAVLGTDGGWLANQDGLIAAERLKL